MQHYYQRKRVHQARTPMLRSLQKAFQIAMLAARPSAPPVDEILEMVNEKKNKSRRNFLSATAKISLAVGAGGLIASCKKADLISSDGVAAADFSRSNEMRIAIVGAGMAGLNCAHKLKQAGISSKVYEASNRSGGRIFTATGILGAGLTTELGGEFIDSIHTDMLNLVAEFGLPIYDTQAASETSLIGQGYFINGQHHTEAQVISALVPYAAQISSDINNLPVGPFTSGNSGFYDNMSMENYFNYIGLTGWLRSLLEVAYLTEYGLEINQQSSINFLYLFNPDTSSGFEIFGASDERYKIAGGNQTLTNALFNHVQNDVIFDRKLTQVAKIGNSYRLTFLKSNGSSTTVDCDVVVLTVPFSILRNVNFTFAMPPWKTYAIQNLGYGTNAKLMMGFSTRHWRTLGYAGYLFTNQNMQNGWDNSQLQPGNAGGYTVFLGGNAGVALGNGSASSQASAQLTTLNQAWPGMAAQYTGAAQRMHWPTNPFAMGSYACYKPGQFISISGNEFKKVGRIFFAGEHCSLDFQGYMNGAAETGRRVASKIINGEIDMSIYSDEAAMVAQ